MNHLAKYKSVFFIIAFALLSQGCAVALLAGTAGGAASSAHDRRTLGTQIDDNSLEFRVSSKFDEIPAISESANINISAFNGVVLLVGQSPNGEIIKQAQKQAELVPELLKLHNQVRIGKPTAMGTRTHDLWLATKIKTKIIADKRVDATHIDVTVEDSEVFLMGLVSQQEASAAVDIARNVDGVTKVVKVFEYL